MLQSQGQALNIVRQLCDVLEYLHRQSPPVIFRDLKPSNVMLTPEGQVKLIDFGVARFFKPAQSQDTVTLGTPGYAAPEQWGTGGQTDARSDIYGLGVLLLRLVTGYDPVPNPFPLPQPRSVMPAISPKIEYLILRATPTDPGARYQSIAGFRRDIDTPSRQLRPLEETVGVLWSTVGQSVRGRDLEVAIIGDTREAAVVVVGSIQGDQPNTRDLINHLINDFDRDPDRIPANVTSYFVPTINPDGNAAGTRRNANNVDLNRNWNTFDWTANPAQPGGVVRGAGGSRPHSESETQSLADYLLSLKRQNSDLRVVVWHSSQTLSSSGHVYPGYTSSGLDRDALSLARRYADITGYAVKEDWAPHETTGELITWCAEEGIEAIDIVIPRSLSGSDRNLRNTTMEALLEIA